MMHNNSWISAKITRAASISTPGHSPNLKKYTLTYHRSYRSSFPQTPKPYKSIPSPITTHSQLKYKTSIGTTLLIK
jgi:hypothetical protein